MKIHILNVENEIVTQHNLDIMPEAMGDTGDKVSEMKTPWSENMIRQNGLIIIAGKSGSGKTTFLKKLLKNLDSPEKTMEDYFKT